MTAEEAVAILFGPQIKEADFDPKQAQFSSGADVAAGLASFFGFTHEDYEGIARSIREGEL